MDDLLEQATKHNQLVVIDFYNDNCPPCETVAPMFQELSDSDEFANKVVFVKVKVDDHPVIVNQYSITGWPTFLFVKNGQVQTEIVGGKLAEATLYDWIKLMAPKENKEQEEDTGTEVEKDAKVEATTTGKEEEEQELQAEEVEK